MNETSFRFKDPIYEFAIKVVITEDIKKWDEMYPNAESSDGDCNALFVKLDGKNSVIIIKPCSPLDDLAHEIGHAARSVMKYIGFKIDFDNDEPLAYYEGYLTRTIHRKINNLKPLTKSKKRA